MPPETAVHRHAAFWRRPRLQALRRRRRSVLSLGIALSFTLASAATAEVPATGSSDPVPASGVPTLPSSWGNEAQRSYPGDRVLADLSVPPASPTADGAALAAIDTRVDINGIPVRVLTAYRFAADLLAREQPRCALPWGVLAAIGQAETGHGRFGGAAVGTDGRVLPEILGPRLDGAGSFAEIRDTDGGLLDGDVEYDRAVGPMQFIPTTWSVSGADADADGRLDPHDIDDVALAAGRYLCAAGTFASPAGSVRAVFSYNHSYEYVRLVLTLAAAYSGRTPASLGIDLLPPPPGAPPAPPPPVAPAPVVLAAPAPPPPPPPPPAAAAPRRQAPAATAPQAPAPAAAPAQQAPPPPPPPAPAPAATSATAPSPAGPSPTPTACPSPQPSGGPSPGPTSCPSPSPSPGP